MAATQITAPFRAAHRARIQRMLSGDVRVEDLNQTFVGLRFTSSSGPAVHEIGHFIAHRDERNTGVVTEAAAGIFKYARFWVSPERQQGHPWRYPHFPEMALLNVELLSPQLIKSLTGRSRRETKRMLMLALAKFIQNPDQSWGLTRSLTNQDEKVLQAVVGTLAMRPSFDSQSLVADLARALVANGIFLESELGRLSSLEAPLSLFAMSMMHGGTLRFEDGSEARLSLQIDDGALQIGATALLTGQTRINFAMFMSDVDAEASCDAILYADMTANMPTASLDYLLELTPALQLSYVGR